jgi:hypothetical protein
MGHPCGAGGILSWGELRFSYRPSPQLEMPTPLRQIEEVDSVWRRRVASRWPRLRVRFHFGHKRSLRVVQHSAPHPDVVDRDDVLGNLIGRRQTKIEEPIVPSADIGGADGEAESLAAVLRQVVSFGPHFRFWCREPYELGKDGNATVSG